MGSVRIIGASAGSGKTHRLVGEYIGALVADPSAYRHILAVTFTNKATAEMKERIVRELNALALGRPGPFMDQFTAEYAIAPEEVAARAAKARSNILHDYSRFSVMTIDKFFQQIIRSFLRELGIAPDFNLELQTGTLLETAADALIEQTAEDLGLKEWIGRFTDEEMDSGKKWDVRGKLASAGGAVFSEEWEGGRGLRKALGEAVEAASRQEAEAIERMQAAARGALAVMDAHGLTAADLPYGGAGVAGYIASTAAGHAKDYHKPRILRALESDEGWASKKTVADPRIRAAVPALRAGLAGICTLWDDHHRLFHSVALLRKRYRSFGLLDDISRQVECICAAQNIMPIAYTNRILGQLIAGNDTPFIFEKTGNTYSRFLIDEFQDTSRRQWENFVPLLRNALAQSDRAPVLLVGDVKQSIYRWRGGDWRILASDAATIGPSVAGSLDTNRRSRGQIVAFNNAVTGLCVERDACNLKAMLDEACAGGYLSPGKRDELAAMLPRAYEGHTQQPLPGRTGGYVTVNLRGAPDEEAPDPVVTRIEELQARGYAPGDILILVRRNDEAQQIARMLLDRKAANPDSPYAYDVVTSEALRIGASPAVEFIMACLRIAADPADTIPRAVWNRHHACPPHRSIPADEEQFLRSLALVPPGEAFQRIALRYRTGDDRASMAYVQALHEQIVRFCNTTVADLPLLLKWWDEQGRRESVYMPANRSAIAITTVHAAKGLQQKAVVLPWCSWPLGPKAGSTIWAGSDAGPFRGLGRVAIGYEKAAAQSYFSEKYYEETVMAHVDNINLLYVALTRARDELHIFLPQPQGNDTTVGELLAAAVAAGEIGGNILREDDALTVKAFGEPVVQQPDSGEAGQEIFTGYPVRDPGMRLRLRLPSSRYAAEDGTLPPLSPRDYGVLMHRVFENAATADDLHNALAAMRGDGALSPGEAARLEQMVSAALADPRVGGWFSGEWEVVRNEHDIILPGTGVRRPDRVMVQGTRAVVVDYKFGTRRDPAYARQIGEYKRIMCDMGYTRVEGYLWYVSGGEVVQV